MWGNSHIFQGFFQSLNRLHLLKVFLSRGFVADLDFASQIEPLHNLIELLVRKMSLKGLQNGGPDQLFGDVDGTLEFSLVLQFQFSGDGRNGRIDVRNTGYDPLLLSL